MTASASPLDLDAYIAGFDTGYATAIGFFDELAEIAANVAQDNLATIEKLQARIDQLTKGSQ